MKKSNEDFTSFMEAFATAKSDRNVRGMILELFTTAQSNPWQSEWLDKLDEDYKKHVNPRMTPSGCSLHFLITGTVWKMFCRNCKRHGI